MKDKISAGLRRLFQDEIANEHIEETGNSRNNRCSPGGENPATLFSSLDSLEQGLYDSDAAMSVPHLKAELQAMIKKENGNTEVRKFLYPSK